MQRLAGALRELGAQLRGADADPLGLDLGSPRELYSGGNFLLHTRHGDLDVFAAEETPGAPSRYEDLRDRAIPIDVRGISLLIAHPEHLIRMKTAARRRIGSSAACVNRDRDGAHVRDALPGQSRPYEAERAAVIVGRGGWLRHQTSCASST